MKRIVLFMLTIILIASTLTSCVIIPIYENFELDSDTVSSIEIYDLCEVDSYYGEFAQTETPVYVIPAEQKADFLNDLAEIRFNDSIVIALVPMDPNFYYDAWTVRINYTDGSYELISSDGFGQTFDSNGKEIDSHHLRCDQDEWWEFIDKYVPDQIFNHSHRTE